MDKQGQNTIGDELTELHIEKLKQEIEILHETQILTNIENLNDSVDNKNIEILEKENSCQLERLKKMSEEHEKTIDQNKILSTKIEDLKSELQSLKNRYDNTEDLFNKYQQTNNKKFELENQVKNLNQQNTELITNHKSEIDILYGITMDIIVKKRRTDIQMFDRKFVNTNNKKSKAVLETMNALSYGNFNCINK